MPKKTLQEGVKAWKRKRKQQNIQANAKHEWDNTEHKFLRKEWHNYNIWKPPKIGDQNELTVQAEKKSISFFNSKGAM